MTVTEDIKTAYTGKTKSVMDTSLFAAGAALVGMGVAAVQGTNLWGGLAEVVVGLACIVAYNELP